VKRLSVVFVLAGLILGPGYYAWASFFSGSTVTEHRLGEKGTRWTLPSGAVLRFSRANAFKPVELELNPAMNTVGFALVFEVVGDVRVEPVRGNAYQALLLLDGTPLLQKQVSISRGTSQGPDQRWSELVATVDVPAAGSYAFVLEETAQPELPLAGITLQVRRNVVKARKEIVWGGVMLLIAGAVAFFGATGRGTAGR
jgi:hypothetical protein